MLRLLAAWIAAFCLALTPRAGAQPADDLPVVRVAVLKYGTANWELALIDALGLDRAHGFRLEVLQRVSPNASLVALQGGAADFTVADWLWVARQHEAGRDFRYYPYSTAVGEVLVPAGSPAQRLEDLAGMTLGVAGGAEDKSWLLVQAFAQRTGLDTATWVKPRYAAPPLLNGLATTGQLDAVLTYWHYAARLKALGFRSLLTMHEILAALGIDVEVPMLGWVFSGDLARANPHLVDAFLRASYAAKAQLRDDDASWEVVRPLMQAEDDAAFAQLRTGYRAGVPMAMGDAEITAIRRVAAIVSRALPQRATASVATDLPPAIFWRPAAGPSA